MSVASPRQSISSAVRSPTSSRTSLDLPQTQRPTGTRRNRAALRDYYNIKPADAEESQKSTPKLDEEASELDKDGFNAAAYVKDIMENQGLEGVLKVEGSLVGGIDMFHGLDIRGLDGERKALVYDNYSKLIAATDTIRKMRSNMEPLTPATSTLAPAISHIAETAAALAKDLASRNTQLHNNQAKADQEESKAAKEKQDQIQTVRWVLDTPRRLSSMITDGQRDDAEADWEDVKKLLSKWQGVKGIEEIRDTCEEILKEPEDDE